MWITWINSFNKWLNRCINSFPISKTKVIKIVIKIKINKIIININLWTCIVRNTSSFAVFEAISSAVDVIWRVNNTQTDDDYQK